MQLGFLLLAAILASSYLVHAAFDNLDDLVQDAEQQQQQNNPPFGSDDGEDIDEAELQRQFAQFQQQDMMGGGGEGGRRFAREIPGVPQDVPYIQCQTCHELVGEFNSRVADRRAKYPKTKLTESQLVEMLSTADEASNMCDPVMGTGQWLADYDIKPEAKNGRLLVERQLGQVGHCEEECKTMAMACENVLHSRDSEMAELAYLRKLTPERVCAAETNEERQKGWCSDFKLPDLPADREDFTFHAKSEMDVALAEASRELRHQQQANPDMFRDDL